MKSADLKREEANARQKERDKLTPQEQLAKLDRMFGKDVGATKERLRLHKAITETADKKSRTKTRRDKKKARK
jgi:hypothetical protein